MKKYLRNLHTKSDRHKKRFAFLFSASLTLLIFGIWSLVMFGPVGGSTLAEEDEAYDPAPLSSLRQGMAAVFQAVSGDFGETEPGLEPVTTYGTR